MRNYVVSRLSLFVIEYVVIGIMAEGTDDREGF